MTNVAVRCTCGAAVPAYVYCSECRKVYGSPNCPCGKPIKGVKVQNCPTCNPVNSERHRDKIRAAYYGEEGCPSGDCTIPTCRTCGNSSSPSVTCEACLKVECYRCSTKCRKAIIETKTFLAESKEKIETVTYSGKGKRYKKGADMNRPAMYVESWEYKKGNVIHHQLIGFEKKEA